MTQDENALIDAALATFPKTFGLRAFPSALLRVGHRMSHFFSEGEMQIVIQAQMADGNWLDFGRNTPEHIHREMTPKTDDRYDSTHPRHRELMLSHRQCVCTACQYVNTPTGERR